jgi:acyl-CoA synthetase (AMP-forming)/AMP-acid ligase II
MGQALVDAAASSPRDLKSLEVISFGASPVPPALIGRVDEVFGGRVAPATGYGMTEATSSIASISGELYLRHPDSVGLPTPVNDVAVADDDGAFLPAGEVGELWVRGSNIISGYWSLPEANAQCFVDGWYRTGDVARIDDAGLIRLVDRKNDMVIRGGENVYCVEVEAVLSAHPAVAAVAVIGIPHESLGEDLVAMVQIRPGATVTSDQLREHAGTRLARFKVPSQVVFVHDDLPRTPTGKILKRELRARLITSR